jgi:hypothetical protein
MTYFAVVPETMEEQLLAHSPRGRAQPIWVRFRGIAVASRWVVRTADGDN